MLRCLVCCVTLLAALPSAARAQHALTLGARVGVHKLTESMSVGGELGIPLSDRLSLVLSVDVFDIDFGTYRAYNVDLKYSVRPALYIGGGATSRWLSAGDANGDALGGDLFVGVESPSDRVRHFAEVHAFLKDGVYGSALAGIRVAL